MDAAATSATLNDRSFKVTNRLVLSIAIPMTIGFVSTPILGLTDTAVVGHSGSAADLAGLGIAAVLFDFIFSFPAFIRTSTTALVAQAYGRNDHQEQRSVFLRSVVTGLVFGLLIIALSPLILDAGLRLLSPEPAAARVVATYFAIRILSSPMQLINDSVLGFVLGRGRAGVALALQTILNGVNIGLSILLGLVFGLGVTGVAWATVIAEIVTALTGLSVAFSSFHQTGRADWKAIFAASKLKALFNLNRDIMIRTLLLTGSFLLMARTGAKLGTATLAANGILMNFFMVSAFFLDGMAAAAEQICGRALGAADRIAFKRAVKLTAFWSFALSGLLALAFLLGGDQVINVLTSAEDVRQIAYGHLIWMALTALTGALAFEMDGVFMGTAWSGEMRNMMILSFIAFCACIFTLPAWFGNHGLWAALNMFLLMRGVTLAAILPGKAAQMFRSDVAGSPEVCP
jgi:multidrug resistance protein, MATE family